MGQIQARFGATAVRVAQDIPDSRAVDISDVCGTGIPELDDLTSIGGIPRGRISLCLGAMGAGKMLVGYHFLAQASQENAAVLMLDLRGHADPWLMAQVGTRLDRLVVLRADEAGDRREALKTSLEAVLALLRAGIGAVLVDLPARSAPIWDPFAATLAIACSRAGAPLLMLGEAAPDPLRYAASLVLHLDRRRWLLRHGDIDGVELTATVTKNKLGPPGGSVDFSLRYPRGTFMAPSSHSTATLDLRLVS